jgi:hypothetical protein
VQLLCYLPNATTYTPEIEGLDLVYLADLCKSVDLFGCNKHCQTGVSALPYYAQNYPRRPPKVTQPPITHSKQSFYFAMRPDINSIYLLAVIFATTAAADALADAHDGGGPHLTAGEDDALTLVSKRACQTITT